MRNRIWIIVALMLGTFIWVSGPAAAKGPKDACKKADEKLARTGIGDSDGDGVSDCREARYFATLSNDPDTDDDGLDDGEEIAKSCDPNNHDTDDDGIEDGDDESPVIEQEIEALLDALTCPQIDVPGSISALGTTARLDMDTSFEHTTCAELAALLAAGGNVLVEIEILEGVLGDLNAQEVELANRGHHDDDDDDDDDDDEDEDDD